MAIGTSMNLSSGTTSLNMNLPTSPSTSFNSAAFTLILYTMDLVFLSKAVSWLLISSFAELITSSFTASALKSAKNLLAAV